jgi:serine/threonine-protein kinase
VHRDLKPSNILLTKDHRVKIFDFGLAQPIQPSDGDPRASSGGTPKYIAPE